MKTELSEEREIRDFVGENCERFEPQAEKNQDTEKASSETSWIILRRHELEVISRFLNVAQKSINNIKDVISKCHDYE